MENSLLRRTGSSYGTEIVFLGLLAALLTLLPQTVAAESDQQERDVRRVEDTLERLWTANIDPLLKRAPLTDPQAYSAGELLMVPLHAAFLQKQPQWMRSFGEYFVEVVKTNAKLQASDLSRLQFLYLGSQFLVLAKNSGHADLIPPELPGLVYSEIRAIWQEKPAWMWDRPVFTGGMRARVLWKLSNREVEKSYYRAILDEDFFLFSVAADLKNYGGSATQSQEWRLTLDDVLSVAYAVFSHEVVETREGGWLMQPGVWRDHPDYQYAGNPEARPEIKPARAGPGIGWDSSHFMRCPLWLRSLRQAYPTGARKSEFYAGLQKGLDKQFFAKVLVPPSGDFSCYRLNNFVDGSNGVYRWNYASLGTNNGYGPYGLSESVVLGWWAFLETEQSRQLYRALAEHYPWPKECMELYLGPNRDRHWTENELSPESSESQLRHLLVLLASEL